LEYPGPQHAISTMATTSASGKGVPASTTTEAASAGAKAHARPRSVPPDLPTCYNCGAKGYTSRDCKAPSKKRARPLAVHCTDVVEQSHSSVVRQERHLSDEVHDMIMQHGGCTHCGLTLTQTVATSVSVALSSRIS
jgi:hypothetical protein